MVAAATEQSQLCKEKARKLRVHGKLHGKVGSEYRDMIAECFCHRS